MGPHESGCTELELFVDTSLLGSKFAAGRLLEKQPEMDMVKLQGDCLHSVEVKGNYRHTQIKTTLPQIKMSF